MLREIGVLLMAFSPLEVGIRAKSFSDFDWHTTLLFFLTGLALFVLGVFGEWRTSDVD
jgi:hypothetical protein